jgi:hypothetical protein
MNEKRYLAHVNHWCSSGQGGPILQHHAARLVVVIVVTIGGVVVVAGRNDHDDDDDDNIDVGKKGKLVQVVGEYVASKRFFGKNSSF